MQSITSIKRGSRHSLNVHPYSQHYMRARIMIIAGMDIGPVCPKELKIKHQKLVQY